MIDLSIYHLSEDAAIVTPTVPGEQSRRLRARLAEVEGSNGTYAVRLPVAFRRELGAVLEDVDGNRYLDFFAGCGVLNVGRRNPDVLAAVRRQADELVHALDFATPTRWELIRKILDHLPAELTDRYRVTLCGPTGADAVEAALKLARRQTRRHDIIAFQGSFHGMTAGALSVTSDTGFHDGTPPRIPGVHFIPYSYCYRCSFGRAPDSCHLECAEYLQQVLGNSHSGIPRPAAIIVEPVQGEGGTIVPRAGYLRRLVEIAHAHDVLVIFDEIQAGFFRTGPFCAFEQFDAVPDIITLSKGLGGIGLPIAAVVHRREIDDWGPRKHIGTFRANQLSMAAGSAAFDFVDEHHLVSHVGRMGPLLREGLEALAREVHHIGEVRGLGLFFGVEYVEDRVTRAPFPAFVSALQTRCLQKGLLVEVGGHHGNVVRLLPPLTVTPVMVQNALRIFREAHLELEAGTWTSSGTRA